MKKFLIVVGAISLALILFVAGWLGLAVLQNRGAHRYADTAIVQIVSHWNEHALLERASPEFLRVTPEPRLDRLFTEFGRLGPLQHYLGSSLRGIHSFWTTKGSELVSVYAGRAVFANGTALITITIVKRNDHWSVAGFKVDGHMNGSSAVHSNAA
jgi:hypothetical protein